MLAAVEARFGTVLKAEAAERGIMPGVAARLHAEGGSVFLKGVPADDPAARLYLRERAANLALAPSVPAPRMLWCADIGGWHLLVFEYIDGARGADLSPGSPDLPAVIDTLARLGGAGGALPCVTANLDTLQRTAAELLGMKPRESWWGLYAEALEWLSAESLKGETLLHYDLHTGNLLTAGQNVFVIDWSFACRGQAWIDAALLAPRLVEAGHSPAQAEALVAAHPGWNTALADAVTGLGALWTMFREYKAMHGPEDIRASRARAAQAGRAWITHRTR
ncbi:phosphotransferase family protein [Actinomadura latina]|uniref:Aminoglycoside phosphotransferase family protein n=1 Tax=Actinomadura latina TaxID=163603 RepID=A0A846YSB9_9ACTN|nr:aminoglycoside phosphotransferase family protein [Actinomadura latina]NKZ03021.1 aminoglycoside phosphotransferase family protein [Actinomadura latina]